MASNNEIDPDTIFVVRDERARFREQRMKKANRAALRGSAAIERQVAKLKESVATDDTTFAETQKLFCTLSRSVDLLRINYALARDTALIDAARAQFGTNGRLYSIILADPPWDYGRGSHKSAASSEYPTMSNADIAAMPVSGLAHEDAALLLWATLPKLQVALDTMAAWGFEYKTVFTVWVKIQRYMGRLSTAYGSYTRPNAELLLVATRGRMRTDLLTKGFSRPNVLLTRRTTHSAKPKVLRDIAVELFGDVPRIELFARKDEDPSWQTWGNQIADCVPAPSSIGGGDSGGEEGEAIGRKRKNNLNGDVLENAAEADRAKRKALPPNSIKNLRGIPIVPSERMEHMTRQNTMSKDDYVFYGKRCVCVEDPCPCEWFGLDPRQRTLKDYINNSGKRHPLYSPLTIQDLKDNVKLLYSSQDRNAQTIFSVNRAKKQHKFVKHDLK